MDNEVAGTGNQYDYGFRIYNPRIAKFLSVDPLTKSYPYFTPYQFAANTPIAAIDLDGLEAEIVISSPWTTEEIKCELGLETDEGIAHAVAWAYVSLNASYTNDWHLRTYKETSFNDEGTAATFNACEADGSEYVRVYGTDYNQESVHLFDIDISNGSAAVKGKEIREMSEYEMIAADNPVHPLAASDFFGGMGMRGNGAEKAEAMQDELIKSNDVELTRPDDEPPGSKRWFFGNPGKTVEYEVKVIHDSTVYYSETDTFDDVTGEKFEGDFNRGGGTVRHTGKDSTVEVTKPEKRYKWVKD